MARLLDRLGTRARNTTRNPSTHAADSTSHAAAFVFPEYREELHGRKRKRKAGRTHIAISLGSNRVEAESKGIDREGKELRFPPLARGLDRRDLKGMQLALVAADRDVFAGREGMPAEPISRFVVVGAAVIVVEHPARMLGAAGPVHQPSDLLVLALPESANSAVVPVFVPQMRVDMADLVERRHELVTTVPRAHREFLRSGKLQVNALEQMRECHGKFLQQAFRLSVWPAATRWH